MSILEQAIAHHQNQPNGEIDVPEWGIKLTWKRLSLHEESRIYAVHAETGAIPPTEIVWARAVWRNALDPDGKKAFSEMDEHKLIYEVDGAVLGRIGKAILAGSTQEGNVSAKVETAKNA